MYELLLKESKTVAKSRHATTKTTHSTAPIQMVNGDGFLKNKLAYRKDDAYQELRDKYRQFLQAQEAPDEHERRREQLISSCKDYIEECSGRTEHKHEGRVQNVKDLLVKLGHVTQTLEDSTGTNSTFRFGEDVVFGLDEGRKALVDHILENNPQVFGFGMIQNDLTDAVWNVSTPTKRFSREEITEKILKNHPELECNPDYVDQMVGRIVGYETHLNDKIRKTRGDENSPYDVWKEFSNARNARELGKEWMKRWKRTSKAGLDYQLCERKKDVYLAFDGLDIANLIKVTDQDQAQKPEYSDSITSGEVRWLYRHRDNADVRAHLKIYSLEGNRFIDLREFFGETDRLDTPLARQNREQWAKYDQYREARRQQRQNV